MNDFGEAITRGGTSEDGRGAVRALGVDLVDVERIAQLLDRHGERFLDRVFTHDEQEYCMGRPRPVEHLAARFAAKEAALKALGTGWTGETPFTSVEVRRSEHGATTLRLSGGALARARDAGLDQLLVSLTHTRHQAMAFVVG